MARNQIDDIYRLTKGKSTKSKIGSRGFPHRLTLEEKERLEMARKRGFLVLNKSSRINISNIYYSICKAKNLPFICFYTDDSVLELRITSYELKNKAEKILNLSASNIENEFLLKVENFDRLNFKQFIMEFYDRKE